MRASFRLLVFVPLLATACPPFPEDICRPGSECPVGSECDPILFRCVECLEHEHIQCRCEEDEDCLEPAVCHEQLCCTPSCEEDGQPRCHDGCGGACECPEDDQVCFEGSCCIPDCEEDGEQACGTGDGCGGTCECPEDDQVCFEGSCCTPDCEEDGQPRCQDGCGALCECPGNTVCDDDGWCVLGCRIDDVFFSSGEQPTDVQGDADPQCVTCLPDQATDEWSPLQDVACEHENPCAWGKCQDKACVLDRLKEVDTPCDPQDLCIVDPVCDEAGQCGTPKDCSSLEDECNEASCNPETGDCEAIPYPVGHSCGERGACDVRGICVLEIGCPDVELTWGSGCGSRPTNGQDIEQNLGNTRPGHFGTANWTCNPETAQWSLGEHSCSPLDFEWALWPLPPETLGPDNYVFDQESGTVRDLITGLVWRSEFAGPFPGSESWLDALSYCENLEEGVDWRLPTLIELRSIVRRENIPAIVTGDGASGQRFSMPTPAGYFWSATEQASDMSGAYIVHFTNGIVYPTPKGGIGYDEVYARCVRSEEARGVMPDRYDTEPDGQTVLDVETGLIWQRGTTTNVTSWGAAEAHCENLVLEGLSDWRLPTVREKESLAKMSRSTFPLLEAVFEAPGVEYYWVEQPAWAVGFEYGDTDLQSNLEPSWIRDVRCVHDPAEEP